MGPKIKKVKSGVKVRVEKTVKDKENDLDCNNNNSNNEIVNNKNDLMEVSPVKQENMDSKFEASQIWLVGDLVWSKIPGHCWWPSMVSYDPCDAIYFTKSKNGKDAAKYHVQFFGDKSLRGWVSKGNMIKFQGER